MSIRNIPHHKKPCEKRKFFTKEDAALDLLLRFANDLILLASGRMDQK